MMTARYSLIQRLLHWTIALLVIGALAAGSLLDQLPNGDLKNQLYATHKAVGVTILGLMLLRVLVRLFAGAPALPRAVPWSQRMIAGLSHAAFYALLIAMPIIGWAATASFPAPVPFFGLVELNEALNIKAIFPADREFSKELFWLHEIIGKVLIAMVALHVLAALHHGIVKKDGVMRRMWFGKQS